MSDVIYNNEIENKTPEDIARLIEDNKGLVKSILRKFNPKPGYEYDEMFQCGMIGLWKGIKGHDPKKGKLTTYSYMAIYWELFLYKRKQKRDREKEKRHRFGTNVNNIEDSFQDVENFAWDVLPHLSEDELSIIDDLSTYLTFRKVAKLRKTTVKDIKQKIEDISQKIKVLTWKN